MKEFNEPIMEILSYEKEDIIVNSGCETSYAGGWADCTSGRAPDFVKQ